MNISTLKLLAIKVADYAYLLSVIAIMISPLGLTMCTVLLAISIARMAVEDEKSVIEVNDESSIY